jgi:hypothetical protein
VLTCMLPLPPDVVVFHIRSAGIAASRSPRFIGLLVTTTRPYCGPAYVTFTLIYSANHDTLCQSVALA